MSMVVSRALPWMRLPFARPNVLAHAFRLRSVCPDIVLIPRCSLSGWHGLHFNLAYARRRPDHVRASIRTLEPRAERREGHLERYLDACRCARHLCLEYVPMISSLRTRRTEPGEWRKHRLLQALPRQSGGECPDRRCFGLTDGGALLAGVRAHSEANHPGTTGVMISRGNSVDKKCEPQPLPARSAWNLVRVLVVCCL